VTLPPPPASSRIRGRCTATIVIGLAGGSGSGKTTIAEALVEAIDGVAYIRHDDYYRHRPELTFEERTRVNYDHPARWRPPFSSPTSGAARRSAGRPSGLRLHHPPPVRGDRARRPAPVVVVEGILVLADEALRRLMDLKIYVDTDADLRLARRMERDLSERGRTPIRCWTST
jgi:uridine kinase